MTRANFIGLIVSVIALCCFSAGQKAFAADPEPVYGPALKPLRPADPLSPSVVQPLRADKSEKSTKPGTKHFARRDVEQKKTTASADAEPAVKGGRDFDWERRVAKSSELEFQGNKALQRGELASAEDLLQQAVQLDNRNYDAWIELGQALDEQGRTGEAFTAYRNGFGSPAGSTVSGQDPALARNAARYGILCETAGLRDAAVQAYNAARKYDGLENAWDIQPSSQLKRFPDPSTPSTWEVLAMLNMMQGLSVENSEQRSGRDGSAKALVFYKEALRLLPNDPVTQYYWGHGLQNVKRYEEAKAAFKQATLLDNQGNVKAAAKEDLADLAKSGH